MKISNIFLVKIIYTFEVQNLSILRKICKIFHADSWQPLKKVAFSRHRNYKCVDSSRCEEEKMRRRESFEVCCLLEAKWSSCLVIISERQWLSKL